jgi:hypothetical protein
MSTSRKVHDVQTQHVPLTLTLESFEDKTGEGFSDISRNVSRYASFCGERWNDRSCAMLYLLLSKAIRDLCYYPTFKICKEETSTNTVCGGTSVTCLPRDWFVFTSALYVSWLGQSTIFTRYITRTWRQTLWVNNSPPHRSMSKIKNLTYQCRTLAACYLYSWRWYKHRIGWHL